MLRTRIQPLWWTALTAIAGLWMMCLLKARAEAPADRYVVTDATVTDRHTKLEWQRGVEPGVYLLWKDAGPYCQRLPLAGGGWRLPAYKELLTIVDPARLDPAFDPTAFPAPSRQTPPNAADVVFWTASPSVGSAQSAWAVGFYLGDGSEYLTSYAARVRCVR